MMDYEEHATEILNELCNSDDGNEICDAIDICLQILGSDTPTHDVYTNSSGAIEELLQPPEGATLVLHVKYGKFAANITNDHPAYVRIPYRGASTRLGCALLAAHVAYKYGNEKNDQPRTD